MGRIRIQHPLPLPTDRGSTEGGRFPVWARNGRELFYTSSGRMMAVDVTTQPTFRAGKPRVLFEGPYQEDFDVAPDGQRFVMVRSAQEQTSPTQVNVVFNWFEDLKRPVPSGK